MRLLLDQDVYAVTARFLVDTGHDVVLAAQIGLSQASDEEILRTAHEENRILITRDRDYGNLVFVRAMGSGVIYLRILPTTVNKVHNEYISMLTIIGCGNLNRSDDAVGVIIAQRLQKYLAQNPHPNVRVYDCGTAGMEVMFQARGSKQLIIIDASSTNSQPGAVFKVPGKELEALPEPSYNLHDFRWDNALAAGRKIFQNDFPEDVIVYLIEAANLDLGLELSPVVKHSADSVFEEVAALIRQNVEA